MPTVLIHCPFRHKPLCVAHSSTSARHTGNTIMNTCGGSSSFSLFIYSHPHTHLCSRCCASFESPGSRDSCRSLRCSCRSRFHRAVFHTRPRLKPHSSVTVLSPGRGTAVRLMGSSTAYRHTSTGPELLWSHWGRRSDSFPVCQCTGLDCIYRGSRCTRYGLREKRKTNVTLWIHIQIEFRYFHLQTVTKIHKFLHNTWNWPKILLHYNS